MNITTKTITPELAQQYLDGHENYRHLNLSRARKYADIMDTGAWVVGPPIVFDGSGKLMDGQTRLQAVVLHGLPVTFAVISGMNHAAVTAFDNGLNRRGADVLRHYDGFSGKNVKLYQTVIRAIHIGCPQQQCHRGTIMNCEYPTLYAEYKEGADFTVSVFAKPSRVTGAVAPFFGAFGRAYLRYPETRDLLGRIARALHDLRFDDRLDPIRLYQKWSMTTQATGWEAYCEKYLKGARAIQAVMRNERPTKLYQADTDPFEI